MGHRKNQNHYDRERESWERQQLVNDISRYIVREYSLHCENGDKVWHPETEPKIRELLQLNSKDGGVSTSFVRHDYGEVLNRFDSFGSLQK